MSGYNVSEHMTDRDANGVSSAWKCNNCGYNNGGGTVLYPGIKKTCKKCMKTKSSCIIS